VGRKRTYTTATAVVAIIGMLFAGSALAAELAVAELQGTQNNVSVAAGSTGAGFVLSLSASGSVACGSTHAARVHTVFNVSASGAVTSSALSSNVNFAASGGTGSNCPITWTGAPTAQTVSASVSVDPATPAGSYFVDLQAANGNVTTLSSNTQNGKLDDVNATRLIFNVSAPSDTTEPIITPNVNGTLGLAGWYTSTVNLSWTVADAESAISNSTGCGDVTITTDMAASTYTCTATSGGGTSSESVTIKRDATAPTAPTGVIDPEPNAAGWNNSDVKVSFTPGTDGLSGIDSCTSPTPVISSGSVDGTCRDKAGNVSQKTIVAVKIDELAPVNTVTGVEDAATYWQHSTPTAGCSTVDEDGGSGRATTAAPSTTGGPVGTVTATCTGGTDVAGNPATTVSASYTVLGLTNFNRNFDGTGVPRAKAGSAIPLAWAVTDGTSLVQPITRATIHAAPVSGACTDAEGSAGTEIAQTTAGSSGLQLLSDGSYQLNYKSSTTLRACHRITVRMFDGPDQSDLVATRSMTVDFVR
jgi:hypothetical protein